MRIMSSELPAELRTLEWLPPWVPAPGTESSLAAELAREVGPGHPLFKRPVVLLGRRLDQDDVLFWLPAGPAALAVVHLTWTGRQERSPDWPWTVLYTSVADWLERGMRADHDATYEGPAPEEGVGPGR